MNRNHKFLTKEETPDRLKKYLKVVRSFGNQLHMEVWNTFAEKMNPIIKNEGITGNESLSCFSTLLVELMCRGIIQSHKNIAMPDDAGVELEEIAISIIEGVLLELGLKYELTPIIQKKQFKQTM